MKGLEPSTYGTTIHRSNQLSYTHHIGKCQQSFGLFSLLCEPTGTPKGNRTPDLLLRRQLLYPTELLAHVYANNDVLHMQKNGAGDGNRTHAASLEGWNSTIELHPHNTSAHQLPLASVRIPSFKNPAIIIMSASKFSSDIK